MKYQCYYIGDDGKRCINEQEACWCSKEHREIWQRKAYGIDRPREKRHLTVEEMQTRLKEIGKQKGIEERTERSGQMRI